MADDASKKGVQDRKRINVNEKYEVAYWSKKFGVSANQLRTAVSAVGVQASAVEKHFRDSSVVTPRKRVVASKKSVSSTRAPDAIALLKADHKKLASLFDLFEKARSSSKKKALVSQICLELGVHAQIEEEIFYPAVKAALRDKALVPEATVEHASVKDLIAKVKDVEPDGEMYDARVKVMSEFVKHHVKEEQNEMFPKAKASRLDMASLGQRLLDRKEELMAQGGPKAPAKGLLGSVLSGASRVLGDVTGSTKT